MAQLSNITYPYDELTAEEIMDIELKVFKGLKKVEMSRDYTVIVDMSTSMKIPEPGWVGQTPPPPESRTRWDAAKECVALLAPQVCKHDSNGITVYLFSSATAKSPHHFLKFENVKTSEDVMKIFNGHQPNGLTNLAAVLTDALHMGPENGGTRPADLKPETLLVITDGEPMAFGPDGNIDVEYSKQEVERVIVEASNSLKADHDLSISFIQIGSDENAAGWLNQLDDCLEGKAKYDIVDSITFNRIQDKRISFEQIMRFSLMD